MIRRIRKTASIKNLFTASCSGQIATLLTLAMVIVLMVIVATIKVGNFSTKATTLSNAADSSALLLASQLSTKAYQLWDSLDDDPNDGKGTTEKCKKSSFLSMLFGAIFAIIVVVICIIFPPFGGVGFFIFTTAMGAIAGAVGGAVGAMASGTDVLQGAAQGAAIGAAIGGIAGGGYGLSLGPWSPLATPALIGMIGTGVMGIGTTIYKAVSEMSATDKSLSEAARALNGLPETDTYRESVFLNALSQTIEDQNTTKTMGICKTRTNEDGSTEYYNCDPHDANNNGDKDEVISYFSYWWDRRIQDLKNLFPKLESRTQDFIKCDTEYQLYTCEAKNNKGGNCEDKKDEDCWQTKAKDEKVPLKDFRYFAQEQYNAAYQCEYSSTTSLSTGSEEYGYNPCASYAYSDEYSAGSYHPVWTPGPLYRPGLTGKDKMEWKKYLMSNLDSQLSRNTCGYDSSSSAEQFKQYKDNLSSEPSEISGGGVVTAVAAALEAKGIGVSFYKSGLTTREEEDDDSKDKDKNTENDNGFCDSCALGKHHDEMEAVIDELNSFVTSVKDLNKQSAEKLASTWESWIKWYYDEGSVTKDGCDQATKENTDDYYDTLQVLVDGEDLDCNGTTGEKNVTLRDCSQDSHPAITDSDGNEIVVDELQGLKAWKSELKDKKKKYIDKLVGEDAMCQASYSYCIDTNGDGQCDSYDNANYYSNSPCIMSLAYKNEKTKKIDYDSTTVTVDGDQDDEFSVADTSLQTLIDEIASVRKEMKRYDTDMNNLYNSSAISFGGKNPVTYRWRDSACPKSLTDSEDWDNDCDTTETGFCHSIQVKTSDFKTPWVKKKKSSAGFLSTKTCLTLTDYCYDPDQKHILFPDGSYACENSYNPVTVTITKKDITKQDMGIMGKFTQQNESDSCENLTQEEKDAQTAEDKQVSDNKLERVTIKKKAKAYFSYYKLGLENWEEKSK